ncbi:AAEL005028-PA [Aedes aegypti]|uniref:AAEL005028-PA n=3 Tax=Aedes aegypti TaxID=7159 RepID=A0A1S4F9C3_AEDAE|nr:uncharacterized protein LOC5565833 isoform X1 [Aedes aegypti]EAT43534.1 AAEL005028-PA [Aedes aegypti]
MESSCRICRKTAAFEPVWLNSWSESLKELISDMYTYCTQLEVSYSDLLPQQICEDCLNRLTMAYDFRKLCRHSDALFREQLRRQKRSTITPVVVEAEGSEINMDWTIKIPEESLASTEQKKLSDDDKMLDLTDHGSLTLKCCFEQCHETTEDYDKLVEHAAGSHEFERTDNELKRDANQNFICRICLKGFDSQTQRNMHQGFIQEIQRLHYPRCGDSFTSGEEFLNHEAKECPKEEKTFERLAEEKGSLLREALIQRILAAKKTDELLRISPEEQAIVKHKLFFSRLRSELKYSRKQVKLYFICDTCNFRAASVKDVKLHLRGESCAKGYHLALGFCQVTLRRIQCLECVTCGHQCIYSKALRRHQERHNHRGIRRSVKVRQIIGRHLPCEYCGRVLASTASRKSHRSRCIVAKSSNTAQILQGTSTGSTNMDPGEHSSNISDGKGEPFITEIKIEEFDPEDMGDHQIGHQEPKSEQTPTLSSKTRRKPKPASFYCVICSYATNKHGNLKRHLQICLGKVPPQQAAYYGEIVKQEMAKNFRKLAPRICERCGYWTNKSGNMKRHLIRCYTKAQRRHAIESDSQ